MANVRIETGEATIFSLINPRSVRITYESEGLGCRSQDDFSEYNYHTMTIDQYNRPIIGTLCLEFISHIIYGLGKHKAGWRVALKHRIIGTEGSVFTVGVGYAGNSDDARQEAFRDLARKLITQAEDGK